MSEPADQSAILMFLDRKGRIAAPASRGVAEGQIRKIVTPLLADR
ncbi:hypothetical protein ACIRPX_35715 [Streptomyces sp. NPDC101225]